MPTKERINEVILRGQLRKKESDEEITRKKESRKREIINQNV